MEQFQYANLDNMYIVKISGRATMKNSKILSDFLDSILPNLKDLSFELSGIEYMDSTFLGLIAKYTIDLRVSKNISLKIINPNEQAKLYLKQTGMDKFLEYIVDEDIKNLDHSKIEGKDFDNLNEKSKYILEMHEILMGLNDENKKVFEPVVEQMRKVVKP